PPPSTTLFPYTTLFRSVELTQLKIQYQRNVGTASASNRIELGATAPAPGSTSSASTFLSLTRERLGFYGRGSWPGSDGSSVGVLDRKSTRLNSSHVEIS